MKNEATKMTWQH